MKTEELIQALAADFERPRIAFRPSLTLAVGAAICIVGAMLIATIGLRPDFVDALLTVRFRFKIVAAMTVAVDALFLFRRCLYPELAREISLTALTAGPLLLLAAMNVELLVSPPGQWLSLAVGQNSMLCLSAIVSLGSLPLIIFLSVLRQGAPTRPQLAGFSAGTLAGAIAAVLYAVHCTDDSPLFVVTWYPIAVGILGATGALAGRFLLRW